MPEADEHTIIGVTPALEHSRRARLLDAFQQAYPVSFVACDSGDLDGLDGLICFATADDALKLPSDLPCLRFGGEESSPGLVHTVSLATHPSLARPLWGSQLTEAHAADLPAAGLEPGEVALAMIGRSPVWRLQTAGGAPHHFVSVAPAELGD